MDLPTRNGKSDQTINEESLLQAHLEMNTGFARCNVESHTVGYACRLFIAVTRPGEGARMLQMG